MATTAPIATVAAAAKGGNHAPLPVAKDYGATAIDSKTGATRADGDIRRRQVLSACPPGTRRRPSGWAMPM